MLFVSEIDEHARQTYEKNFSRIDKENFLTLKKKVFLSEILFLLVQKIQIKFHLMTYYAQAFLANLFPRLDIREVSRS